MTAVELLPVQQFVSEPEVMARGLTNYWGYNTIGFFAPHNAYSSSGDRGQQVTEFKQMVKAFHAAGIEVIPRRRLQPHGRGRRRRTDLAFRGYDDLGFYTARGRPATTRTGTSPGAATPSMPQTRSRCG